MIAPLNSSSMSSSLGMGCLYHTMMLLIARQSTHILHEPSFLGTKRTGTRQGERLSCTYPFLINSSTCCWISFVSSGLVRYAARFGSEAPGIRSIWCSISLLGGSPGGTSSGNTSSYSYNTLKTTLGKVEDKSLVERKFSLYRSTKNMALGSLNSFKSPFLAIITNPSFPVVLVLLQLWGFIWLWKHSLTIFVGHSQLVLALSLFSF